MSVELKTDRLVIRDFQVGDWRDVYEYASDPVFMRFSSSGPLSEVEVQEAVLNQAREPSAANRMVFTLAIELTDRTKVVGTCSLFLQEHDSGEATIHCGVNRAFWGQGLATEALGELLRFAFVELGLHRVSTRHVVENNAPGRVLEKLGFTQTGLVRGSAMIQGIAHDEYAYAISRSEWGRVFAMRHTGRVRFL